MSGGLPFPDSNIDMGDYKDFPPNERPSFLQHSKSQGSYDDGLTYGAIPQFDKEKQYSKSTEDRYHYPTSSAPTNYQYATTSQPLQHPPSDYQYERPAQYKYAPAPDAITYSASPANKPSVPATAPSYTRTPQSQQRTQTSYITPKSSNAHVVEVRPGMSKVDSGLAPQMDRLAINGNRLSVSGGRPDLGGGLPPPSPLLEAYRGTYQSISPMVAPMMLHDDELSDLAPLSPSGHVSGDSKHRRRKSSSASVSKPSKSSSSSQKPRRIKIYDAEADALALNEAIKHHKIDTDAICDILPRLTHDQMLELRNEYKKHIKVQGRGVNVAKHLKTKLSGNFGKAAYVCALGRFESETYWANFFYQSHNSRRELLIEALMGRSNIEIREIVDAFKDKRYSDNLVSCMERELKADKFRAAVLSALEGRRQEETEVYPREYVDKDAVTLNRCISAREGGESTMLEIIVRRSDHHLREVLRAYERQWGANFAVEALKKSNNLVGEVTAHILNGVINKPARDAILLRHAIDDISAHKDELRYELLISRLVRYHWDRSGHLERVKTEYYDKYHKELEDDIEDATRGDFREFMLELVRS
ncbi:hypothetical protein MBLNU459_g6653t2 [Dothideomycetes sp. NU459]